MLRSIDRNWVQHLTTMESLRQGIGLQAVGQRDPLVMYRKEGHEMFRLLQERIQDDVSHSIFRAGNTGLGQSAPAERTKPRRMSTPPTSSGSGPSRRATAKIGRNSPCPCGSGKKYKRCCAAA